MSESKRLHPIASIIQTAKKLRSKILPLLALIFTLSRDGIDGLIGSLIIALAVIVITLISGILSWLRFTYRLEDNELRIEYGVIFRKKRYIPFERIQSIDLTEGLLQRLFGLVKVQIETAGGGRGDEPEAVLSAISKKEAELIQNHVAAAKNARAGADANQLQQEGQPIFKISSRELILLSITSGGVGVVFSAVIALLSQLDDLIPYKRLFGGFEKWAEHNLFLIAIFVFVGFFVAWIISLIITMLKYADFTVVKKEKDLIISQGLLERRQITIPLKRIQAIRINESIIRQIIGWGTVLIESAGGSSVNEAGANVTLLPIVRVKQIHSIMAQCLPDYVIPESFTTAPKRARWRYIFRTWYFMVPIVIAALIFLRIWGLLSLIPLILFTLLALAKYKAAGWSMDGQQLSLRYRNIKRTTVLMEKNKIQSLEIRESYFQRKRELSSIDANVKSGAGGGGGAVIDLEKTDVQQIFEWYTRSKKRDGSE